MFMIRSVYDLSSREIIHGEKVNMSTLPCRQLRLANVEERKTLEMNEMKSSQGQVKLRLLRTFGNFLHNTVVSGPRPDRPQ